MLNIFKSKAQKEAENLLNQADPATILSGLLMICAKNHLVVHNKDFLKAFKKAQEAWFDHYEQAYHNKEVEFKFDRSNNDHRIIMSGASVIIGSILEGDYTVEDLDQIGVVNIMKQEANLNNVPRVYADAYIKHYETEGIIM